MTSRSGRKVPNQFIISDEGHGANGNFKERKTFQSYNSTIMTMTRWEDRTDIEVGNDWNYSATTRKYLYQFLNDNNISLPNHGNSGISSIQHMIDTKEWKLTDLNGGN